MKKKHRTITIDGEQYGWVVGEDRWDYMEKWFTIYKNKKPLKCITIKDKDSITPKMVEEAIRNYNVSN
jgi:hypothetical protein